MCVCVFMCVSGVCVCVILVNVDVLVLHEFSGLCLCWTG